MIEQSRVVSRFIKCERVFVFVCICTSTLAHLSLYPQWSLCNFLYAWLLNPRS